MNIKIRIEKAKSLLSHVLKKKTHKDAANHGNHLITDKSSTRVLEAYRMTRTNLFYSGTEEGGTVFGVTSSSPSDGKSLTCANLAISFAMSGKRVLLIDCDMRKPTQKLAFGATVENGLSEFLAGVTAEPEIVSTSYEGLSLLTAGRCPPNPAELLFRPRFADLIARVKNEYDFVFVDMPPVGIISDAAVVAPHIGAYVFVARAGESDQRLLRASVESIESVGGKIAGFILNDVGETTAGGYGSYGRYYGRYYRKYYTRYEVDDNTSSGESVGEESK